LEARTSAQEQPAAPAILKSPSDLRARIGQMVMVGFRGLTAKDAGPTLQRIKSGLIGAVVLYDVDAETGGPRNIQSPDQLRELTAALHEAGSIPVLVAVDAEGGFYHRLKEKYGFPPATPAQEMGERNNPEFTRAAAGVVAATLADAGVDLNLAPVVDLLNPANLTVSARRRSFASDPAVVTAHAREFILAHRERGVLTALKHFPGMGGVLKPYSPGLGELTEDWSPAELVPYKNLVAEGLVDAILATRVSHPELDADYPGCLSKKVIQDVLRKEIGYDGVAISDAMEMLAIWDVFGFERGTILAVNAGVDMVLFCNESGLVPYDDDRAQATVEIIAEAIARGEIAEERVDEACGRILALKSRLGPEL
jgi:beta-N-acetylhexosaminidase